ncbi:hypothetical protein [Streptomyces soliscabiei]|uniref:hypothetical protein n=1 Tax=Streptomyces soliscabiei TaxID=588897 RepID=UPI0029BCC3B5|nr:hypothetical protein [Streptomyces sp. NY05-11A]MDX2683497.1 hypothetical protein [Streptomyces sp. NY05-11A]
MPNLADMPLPGRRKADLVLGEDERAQSTRWARRAKTAQFLIAAEIAHPVDSQGDRLMLNVWVIAVLGLPLLLHQLIQGRVDGEGVPQLPVEGTASDSRPVAQSAR